jgi:hypothetical protein
VEVFRPEEFFTAGVDNKELITKLRHCERKILKIKEKKIENENKIFGISK